MILRRPIPIALAAAVVGALAPAAAAEQIVFSGLPAGQHDIVAGADGAMWFSMPGAPAIGRITTSGAVTTITAGVDPGAEPAGVALGPDDAVWFADPAGAALGRVAPDGHVTTFATGLAPDAGPVDVAAGPDGAVWFTAPGSGAVGRLHPGTGDLDLLPLPDGATPLRIAPGPDGNLWFTDPGRDLIGRVTPEAVVTEFPATGAGPLGITAGPDGNMWFAAYDGDAIGRVSMTGVVATIPCSPGCRPLDVAAGPDGRIWIVLAARSRAVRVRIDGSFDPLVIRAPDQPLTTDVQALAAGPGGYMWAATSGGEIARIVPTFMPVAGGTDSRRPPVSPVLPVARPPAVVAPFRPSVSRIRFSGAVMTMRTTVTGRLRIAFRLRRAGRLVSVGSVVRTVRRAGRVRVVLTARERRLVARRGVYRIRVTVVAGPLLRAGGTASFVRRVPQAGSGAAAGGST